MQAITFWEPAMTSFHHTTRIANWGHALLLTAFSLTALLTLSLLG